MESVSGSAVAFFAGLAGGGIGISSSESESISRMLFNISGGGDGDDLASMAKNELFPNLAGGVLETDRKLLRMLGEDNVLDVAGILDAACMTGVPGGELVSPSFDSPSALIMLLSLEIPEVALESGWCAVTCCIRPCRCTLLSKDSCFDVSRPPSD